MDFKQTYFSIWQEIWNLHKKYAFISKDDIPQWENLTMEASRIHDKYSDSVGAKFAEALLFAVTAEIVEKRNRTSRIRPKVVQYGYQLLGGMSV